LIGLGTVIPLATELAEAGPKRSKRYKKRQRHWIGVKKYSKRWWQLYRAQERRKKARAYRLRQLRLRQLRLAEQAKPTPTPTVQKSETREDRSTAMLPSGEAAPTGWKRSQANSAELQFSVDDGNGTAAIAVVGPALGESVDSGRNRTVGGVPTTSLRREVINRMIRENGWVVNDFQKDIAGKPVYVVVAQSQGQGGRVNSRMFYFTEVNGRIYSVSTNSNTSSADRIAEESEKVIFSLQGRSRPIQQAIRE
jgi:hypothetical protein